MKKPGIEDEIVMSWSLFKRYLTVFVPSAVMLALVLAVFWREDVRLHRNHLEAMEASDVELQKRAIARDIVSILSDLMFLGESEEIFTFLETQTSEARQDVEKEYRSFSKRKGIYDQIRFLDSSGMEIVRVNNENGKHVAVRKENLQNKGDRYYFANTWNLNQGQVFASPLDLNVEHGRLEEPLKPVMRFGTPVYDRAGNKRGVVILNYLGNSLIKHLMESTSLPPERVMLLNPQGYWLVGPSALDLWGFMYPDRKGRTFGSMFPEAWKQISSTHSGQISTKAGLFTFSTVYPLCENPLSPGGCVKSGSPGMPHVTTRDYYWKIVSYVSRAYLKEQSGKRVSQILKVYGILVLLPAAGCLFFARAVESRKRSEEAIFQAKEDWERTFNAVSDPIVVLDETYRIVRTNQAVNGRLGLDQEQLLGKPCHEMMHLKDNPPESCRLLRYSRGRNVLQPNCMRNGWAGISFSARTPFVTPRAGSREQYAFFMTLRTASAWSLNSYMPKKLQKRQTVPSRNSLPI